MTKQEISGSVLEIALRIISSGDRDCVDSDLLAFANSCVRDYLEVELGEQFEKYFEVHSQVLNPTDHQLSSELAGS